MTETRFELKSFTLVLNEKEKIGERMRENIIIFTLMIFRYKI
jgi:hypothetical protein